MSVFHVTTAAQLTSALVAAVAGDTISLAAGNYGSVAISNRKFSGTVTIVSADPAAPAQFDSLSVSNSSGLSFESLDIGHALAAGEPNFTYMARVTGSSNISFVRNSIHGSLDNNPGNDGNGLNVTSSARIRVIENEFEQLGRGAVFNGSTDIEVKGNAFHDIRSDAADFAAVQRVQIIGNSFRNFYPVAGDHSDAIQFFTTGTTVASRDILIAHNVIHQGEGLGVQGIFLKDEVGTLPYQQVRISNNLIYVNDGYHGISVQGARGLTVENNSAVSQTTDSFKLAIRVLDVSGALVKNNVTDTIITTGSTDVVTQSNVRLDQTPARASEISGINDGPNAVPGTLTLAGVGYQTEAPSTSPARTGSPHADGFYLGATLRSSDIIDGRDGNNDQVGLQGDYPNLVLGPENLRNIESLVLLSGQDTRFGDVAGNLYSYNITTVDANVAAGATLIVSYTQLKPGENLVFNGSAETDGRYFFYAGKGVDRLTGGAGNDAFLFQDGAFTPEDRIIGGAGMDQVGFRGNHSAGLVFEADTIQNVEIVALISGSDTKYGPLATGYGYNVTLNDGNVAAGEILTVTGYALLSDERMIVDGSAERNGHLRLYGGQGSDELTGGAGQDVLYGALGTDLMNGGAAGDTFLYRYAADSTGPAFDRIVGFDYREDKIDLQINHSGFSDLVMGGRLSAASLEADLDTALEGLLGAGEAALFSPNAGDLAGRIFAVVDMDGLAGYDSGADLLIEMVNPVLPIPNGTDIFI